MKKEKVPYPMDTEYFGRLEGRERQEIFQMSAVWLFWSESLPNPFLPAARFGQILPDKAATSLEVSAFVKTPSLCCYAISARSINRG